MKDYKEIERFLDYIDRHINGDVLLKGGEESTYPYAHYERLLDNIYEYTKFIFENKQKNKQRLAEDDNYSNEQEIVMEDKGMFNDIRDYFNGPPSESLHVVAPAGPREDPGKNSSQNDSISSLFSYEPSSKPSSMEYEKESDDTDFWGNPVKEEVKEVKKEPTDFWGNPVKEEVKEVKKEPTDFWGNHVKEEVKEVKKEPTDFWGNPVKEEVKEVKKEPTDFWGNPVKEEVKEEPTDFWGNPVKEVKEEIRELTSNGNNEGSRTLWESMTYTPSEEVVNKPNIEEVVPEPPKKRLLLKGEEMV
uniref:Uncharacterized protein n=1 Tax=viral metagenome TaxID=1070528 RepID=A0A6C0DZM5_9ZZZZ